MVITLSKLVLINFKGARNVIVDFSDRTCLFGRNETGKTTLFDGWYYLLFDKDSSGAKEFGIKTTDPDGNVLHGLDHSVEGTLFVDGKRVVLKKVYAENWVKKRGSADQEFTGHSTTYYIDEVPVKQKEYRDYIDSLVQEDLFRLLTDPMYFNVHMSWQQRRALLLEVCGDVTDADVIASDGALAELPSILGDHSLDDYRKILAAKRTKINKDLTAIPVRIDEAERSKPDVDGLNEATVSAQVEALRVDVATKESELARLQSGGEIAEQENRLRVVEGELLHIKNNSQSELMEQISQQRKFVSETEQSVATLFSEIGGKGFEIEQNTRSINLLRSKVDELRQTWVHENDIQFGDAHVDDACPACGRSLPSEKVQAAVDKAVADFNLRKSRTLESLQNEAVAAKNRIDELEIRNQTLQSEVEALEARVKSEQRAATDAKATLDKLQAQVTDPTQSLEYRAKALERQAVADKLAKLRESMLGEVEHATSELNSLRNELRNAETQLAHFTHIKTLDARIAELKADERKLAAEYEETERELYLSESFIRAKVALLDARINSKFEITRFRLHQEQVNGGLSECCVALHKGVAYDAGLNTGGRILVGLDIIRTLQRHYGIYAPVWVDNDESLTSDVEMDCQLIELIASRPDKVLRVEHVDNKKEAV